MKIPRHEVSLLDFRSGTECIFEFFMDPYMHTCSAEAEGGVQRSHAPPPIEGAPMCRRRRGQGGRRRTVAILVVVVVGPPPALPAAAVRALPQRGPLFSDAPHNQTVSGVRSARVVARRGEEGFGTWHI